MKTEEIRNLNKGDLCPYCTKHILKNHCDSPTCKLLRCSMCHLNIDTERGRVATDK